MKKIIPVTIFCFSLLTSIDCQSQKTALLYQESKRAFIETTVDKNGIISFTSVPDSIVVFIGTSAAGRIIQFNKDSDVFYLSMDNKEKEGLSVLPYLNKEKLVLVFRNNELIAINQNLITPRKLIPDKAGKPYITILSTSVAVATAAKSPCAEIDKSNPTLNDARIIAKTEITDTISFLPHNFTTTPEDILYLVNKFDHHSGHLPKNYIIHDTRKGTTKTFSIKRDKGNSVINTFDAKVKNYITTLIITTKKEKPVLHINETDFVIDQKPGFEAAVSAIIKTPDEENTNPVPFETLLPKTGKSVDTDPKNLSGLVDQLVNTAIKGRKANNKLIDTLAKELKLCFSCVDSLKQQIEDLTLSNDELKKKIVTLLSSSIKLTELKERLLALERDLEKFNAKFKNSSWASSYYDSALLHLRLQIKKIFQISVTSDGGHLFNQLMNVTKSIPEYKNYLTDFCGLMEAIKNEYQLASHQFDSVFVYEYHHTISNNDQLAASIKTNEKETVLLDTKTYGGLKIDFSSGFFFHGINNMSYTQSKQSFRYKEQRLSVNTVTGQLDSSFTGAIKDTSGLLIYNKTRKINYSAAFLANIYTRSRGSVNHALSFGFMLNNSDNNFPLNLMAGYSFLVQANKTRIAVSLGTVWGKRTVLPVEAEPYVWNKETNPANRLYNSKYDVPKFVDGDIQLDYKGALSWYFGLSFSFASTGK